MDFFFQKNQQAWLFIKELRAWLIEFLYDQPWLRV